MDGPALSTPTSTSTSTQQQTTAPECRKLRHSCHACASSKLKCSQDKPICSRCAKRGLNCEYVAAKPGGRKPNRQSSNNNRNNVDTNENVHLSSQANWFTLPPSNPSIDFLRSPGTIHHSPKSSISGSSDTWTDLLGPMDQTLSSTSTVAGNDLDDLFNSPIPFSTEISDTILFKPADFFHAGIENNSNAPENLSDANPAFENAVSEFLALSVPSSTPNISTSLSMKGHEYHDSRATGPPCSCLVQALGFMKELFPSPSSSDCMTWAAQGVDKATAIPTIQATIAQNETIIEAVGVMLNCPSCPQDGYLLAVMSLIIFRVLGWYAAVARQTSSLDGSPLCRSRQSSPPALMLETPVVVGSYRLAGTDSPRMAAQLILSELHRVRHLVNQLSLKLKMQAAKNGRKKTETPDNMELDNEMTLPLSAMMYDQLDSDLRKQLMALSSEMIDRLKKL